MWASGLTPIDSYGYDCEKRTSFVVEVFNDSSHLPYLTVFNWSPDKKVKFSIFFLLRKHDILMNLTLDLQILVFFLSKYLEIRISLPEFKFSSFSSWGYEYGSDITDQVRILLVEKNRS